jgi:uncharacterized membrane protein YbhN (UPF0104 family)
MTATPQPPGRQLRRWAARIGTILVSAAILYYYLRRLDWPGLADAAARADFGLAAAGIVIPLIGFWVTDAIFTTRSFAWFDQPVACTDYFIIKAAAYLLAMVNVSFATGGVFLYFTRKTGIGFAKQTGLMAWRLSMAVFGFVLALAGLIAAVLLFAPGLAAEMRLAALGPAIALILLLMIEIAAFCFYRRGLILRRLPLKLDSDLFAAFLAARPRHWGLAFAYTVPPIVLYFVGMYLVARAFHLQVPFFYFLLRMPLAALVAGLPVAFGGFGTTTAAWHAFFKSYGSEADIAAVTLFIPALRLATRALIGFLFMPLALRELERLRRLD